MESNPGLSTVRRTLYNYYTDEPDVKFVKFKYRKLSYFFRTVTY